MKVGALLTKEECRHRYLGGSGGDSGVGARIGEIRNSIK